MTYVSFIATATLTNGVSIDPRFGVGLDSLLASSIREQKKRELGISGEEYDGGLNRYEAPEINVVPLPLSVCSEGQNWHWMSTCALPTDSKGTVVSVHDIDVQSRIQIDDHKALERSVGKLPANISSSSGRWKLSRSVTPVTLAQHITWTGHGDIVKVGELLDDVHSVGAGRKAGIGNISAWRLTATESSGCDAGHLGIDQRVARPIFEPCLQSLSVPIEIDTLESIESGYRPPYWHLGHQADTLIDPRR